MSTPELEAFLARLYTDPDFRARVLADPEASAGLDISGLLCLARSLEAKKKARVVSPQDGTSERRQAAQKPSLMPRVFRYLGFSSKSVDF